MNVLGFQATPEFWAICTLIVSSLAKGIWDILKRYQDRKDKETLRKAVLEDREEVRKDLKAQAELLKQGFQTVDENGKTRLVAIMGSNITTRGMVKEYAKKADLAIETSNGIKKDVVEKLDTIIEAKKDETTSDTNQSVLEFDSSLRQ